MKSSLQICAEFLRARGATEIYVFGSVARGTADTNSDLDLAVRGLSSERYYRTLAELEEISNSRVDLVILDDGGPFAKHIECKILNGWASRVA